MSNTALLIIGIFIVAAALIAQILTFNLHIVCLLLWIYVTISGYIYIKLEKRK